MTVNAADARSRFARLFERAYRDVPLPAVYREFIVSDAYRPYRHAVIHGLRTYGPSGVTIDLASPVLLQRAHLFDESDIDRETAAEYHPIAIVRQSPQFLAIAVTSEAAPVFLWHHETGAFHPQCETFTDFVAALTTLAQERDARRRIRQTFAAIRKDCVPALARARTLFNAGDVHTAGTVLDAVLETRRPIRYDGRNDFRAIGILCDCFNLRGRVWLAADRLDEARAAFLDASRCGGTPYWEAAVDLVVTSCLLNDLAPALAEVGQLTATDFPQPPGSIARRNFSAPQIDAVRAFATSLDRPEAERGFLDEVLRWLAEPPAAARQP